MALQLLQPQQVESVELEINKPPLKWAGGKRWLVPHLKEITSGIKFQRLVEPFCGGLSVALGLKVDEAVLNDINPHLINFYKQIQKGLIVKNKLLNDENYFYSIREKFNQLILNNEINIY